MMIGLALVLAAFAAALNPFVRGTAAFAGLVTAKMVLPYILKGGFETREMLVRRSGLPCWRLRLRGWSSVLRIHCVAEREVAYAWL